jgi:hypothetical protein
MIDMDQYKTTNGFYDTERMMRDAGVNVRAAAFDAIFGDVQGTPEMPAEWAAAVASATAHNDALLRQIGAEREAEARAAVAAAGGPETETWPRETWKRLQALGYAWYTGPDETGHWYAGLNADGERLLGETDA